MAVTPFKTFAAGEILTASDLNSSFSQVFDNGQTLGWPATEAKVFADNELSRANLKDYGEVTNVIGATGGGTQDIDLTLGNSVSATVDTSANTFTFSNPTASPATCSFTLFLTNGGSQTVNWPASVAWPGGIDPTLTASGLDILYFTTIDGGTTWHGSLLSDAGLHSIAQLTTAADRMIYTTASEVYAVATLTAAGRALLDDASAAAQRNTLGVGAAQAVTFGAVTGTSFTIGSAAINEAELEILDGATLSTTELNKLDGATLTTTELNFVDGVTSSIQTQLNALSADIIEAGTVMLFFQAAAPTGWTKSTANNNKALRVVSGSGGGTAGTVAFTTAFGSARATSSDGAHSHTITVATHALSTAELASHEHLVVKSESHVANVAVTSSNSVVARLAQTVEDSEDYNLSGQVSGTFVGKSSATGSGTAHGHSGSSSNSTGAHTHTTNLDVQYLDLIVCTKD